MSGSSVIPAICSDSCIHKMSNMVFDKNIVLEVLKNLPKTAQVPDGIPAVFFHTLVVPLVKPLMIMFQ